MRFPRKIFLLLVPFLFIGAAICRAQDPEVRVEAVRLVERANAVSMSPNLPNLERTDAFRVFGSEAGIKDGTFTRAVIQHAGRRDEVTFGDYHSLEVLTQGGNIARVRNRDIAPPEVETFMQLTPIWLLRFDESDVIHSIATKSGGGRALRCIEFETIRGERRESNEFCIDPATGTFASQKIGDSLVEYSEFFPFAGAMMPGKIGYSVSGVRKMEITQTMKELKDEAANVLVDPPNATLWQTCTTFRRPIGDVMPQPKPGTGARNVDVLVRGIVGVDGRVHQAVVQNSEGRQDLEAEALSLIQQWTFSSPLMCNGRPGEIEAEFVCAALYRTVETDFAIQFAGSKKAPPRPGGNLKDHGGAPGV